MKALFSVVGLLVVLAIVALIAHKQLGSSSVHLPQVPGAPAAAEATATPATVPAATPQQQVKQAVEGLMQPRAMPEGK